VVRICKHISRVKASGTGTSPQALEYSVQRKIRKSTNLDQQFGEEARQGVTTVENEAEGKADYEVFHRRGGRSRLIKYVVSWLAGGLGRRTESVRKKSNVGGGKGRIDQPLWQEGANPVARQNPKN